jgi:pyruvate/2-oxoglutarate dehydrogenase complex dihydrolipoamide acyltransferase (E2) component
LQVLVVLFVLMPVPVVSYQYLRVNATPSARRYARENGVNLAEVSPKTNDVVRKEDIDKKQQAPGY